MSDRKLGAGHAEAMFRLGLKEMRNAFNPSRESVADSELGLYGTETQGEIAAARGGVSDGLDIGPDPSAPAAAASLKELRADADSRGKDDDQGQDRSGLER